MQGLGWAGPLAHRSRTPSQQVIWHFKGTVGRGVPFSREEAKRSKEKIGSPAQGREIDGFHPPTPHVHFFSFLPFFLANKCCIFIKKKKKKKKNTEITANKLHFLKS